MQIRTFFHKKIQVLKIIRKKTCFFCFFVYTRNAKKFFSLNLCFMNTQETFKQALKTANDEQVVKILKDLHVRTSCSGFFKTAVQRDLVVVLSQKKPRINKNTRALYQLLVRRICVAPCGNEDLQRRARKFAKANNLDIVA